MDNFRGTTLLQNFRVKKVIDYVYDAVGHAHNEIDKVYDKHSAAFEPKWYHKLFGINDLESWLDNKFEYNNSNVKSLYLSLKDKSEFDNIAEKYQDIYQLQSSKFWYSLFYLKFYDEYQELKQLVKSEGDIYVTPEQIKFITYIEERMNG